MQENKRQEDIREEAREQHFARRTTTKTEETQGNILQVLEEYEENNQERS